MIRKINHIEITELHLEYILSILKTHLASRSRLNKESLSEYPQLDRLVRALLDIRVFLEKTVSEFDTYTYCTTFTRFFVDDELYDNNDLETNPRRLLKKFGLDISSMEISPANKRTPFLLRYGNKYKSVSFHKVLTVSLLSKSKIQSDKHPFVIDVLTETKSPLHQNIERYLQSHCPHRPNKPDQFLLLSYQTSPSRNSQIKLKKYNLSRKITGSGDQFVKFFCNFSKEVIPNDIPKEMQLQYEELSSQFQSKLT